MALFPTWREWMKMRESNARKRAVRAALNGTGVELPGSYAACPSTNPRAMKVANKKGVVGKQTIEETEQRPDYSFDRWVQKAKEFGDDVNKMRTNYEDEDEKLDNKKKDAEKKADEEDKKPSKEKESESHEGEVDSDTKKKMGEAWKRLQKIHQDKLKSSDKESSGPSEDSDD